MSKAESESDNPAKEFFEFFKERLGNPFFQAFSFCWLITNFKVLLVVFGEGDFEKKITYLGADFWRQQACIFDDKSWCVIPGDPRLGSIVGIPLLLSFIYLIVVALCQVIAAGIQQLGMNYQKAARVKVDDQQDFASADDLRSFKRKYLQESSAWEADRKKLSARNDELEDGLRRLATDADERLSKWLDRTLAREAESWGDDLVKIHAEVQYRSYAAQDILVSKGIPKSWAVTLMKLGFGKYITSADFARELNAAGDADYALEILARLGPLRFDYTSGTRRIYIDENWQHAITQALKNFA